MSKKILVFILVFATVSTAALAGAPKLIPVQGVLTDVTGNPIEGTQSMTFSMYDSETGTTPIWYETQDIAVSNGFFTAYLGDVAAIDLVLFKDHQDLWLGVKVNSGDEMPRVYLGSTPFTAFSEYCGTVPSHTHPFSEITGTMGESALPATVPIGPQGCDTGYTASGINDQGKLVCTAAQGFTAGNGIAIDSGTRTISVIGCADGKYLRSVNGVWTCVDITTPSGTVTSVGLAMPSDFTVSGSPVTISGTLSASWSPQSGNKVLASPADGSAGTPAFRGLAAADIPHDITVNGYLPLSGGSMSGNISFNISQLFDGVDVSAHVSNPDAHHLRQHSIASTLDHQASQWQVFYSDGTGTVKELPLGIAGKVLKSNGANVAPSWQDESTGGGTVTSITAGSGLSGGTITTSGTIAVKAAGVTNAMLENSGITVNVGTGMSGGGAAVLGGAVGVGLKTCTQGKILKYQSGAWDCANDENSGGTVTLILTGDGLTGGPISSTGLIGIASGGVTNDLIATPYVTVAGGGGLTGGGQVSLGGSTAISVADKGVTGSMLADGAVDNTKIADLARFVSVQSNSGTEVFNVTNQTPGLRFAGGHGTSVSFDQDTHTVTIDTPVNAGTVTSVTAGAGLTGGTITTSGTIALDTAKVPVLDAANTFTGQTQTILSGAATALVLKDGGPHPADLLEFQSSAGAIVARVTYDGVFYGSGAGLTGIPGSAVTSIDASKITGTLPASNGGTGLSSYTVGDLLYASGTSALSKLSDTAAGNALISGGVGAAPSWGKIALTSHVNGVLPVTNGGTGSSTQNFVDLTLNQTIGGTKTFTSTIAGDITGTASGFTGSLSGDVTGTQSATVVGKIQGRTVSSAAPSTGQHLRYNGSQWVPSLVALATDVSGTLPTDNYSAYADLGAEGYLNNDGDSDLLTRLQSDGRYWRLAGNAGTNPPTDFIGTTDAKSLDFKVNNQRAIRISPGTASPMIVKGSDGNVMSATADGSVIGGGGNSTDANSVFDSYCVIGGGAGNIAGTNDASAQQYATVGGGYKNQASNSYSNVTGGFTNKATGDYAFAGGGNTNEARGGSSAAVGGASNLATGTNAAVTGGYSNTAGGNYSFIAGGYSNTIGTSAHYSFAGGYYSNPTHAGSFIWSDGSSTTAFASDATNQFKVRSTGGAKFVLNGSGWTCSVTGGGSWSCSSDRNLKENFVRMDGRGILEKVASLPVYTWSAKGEDPKIRHMGPTAQDFHEKFSLGDTDKSISTIDLDGVALASIQGLNSKVDDELRRLSDENESLKARLSALEAKLAASAGTGGQRQGGGTTWLLAGGMVLGAIWLANRKRG